MSLFFGCLENTLSLDLITLTTMVPGMVLCLVGDSLNFLGLQDYSFHQNWEKLAIINSNAPPAKTPVTGRCSRFTLSSSSLVLCFCFCFCFFSVFSCCYFFRLTSLFSCHVKLHECCPGHVPPQQKFSSGPFYIFRVFAYRLLEHLDDISRNCHLGHLWFAFDWLFS